MKRFGLPTLGVIIIILTVLSSILFLTIDTINLSGRATAGTRVNIVLGFPSNCSLSMPAGINQVSFYCIPNGNSVNDTMSSINYDWIFTYEANDANDKWKATNPSLPWYVVNDLTDMSRIDGYYVKVSTPQNYFYVGERRVPNDIPIVPGWNFVGYPTNTTKNVNTTFSTILGSFIEIRSYNNSALTYETHFPETSGSMNNTYAYQAFWINANATDTLTIT